MKTTLALGFVVLAGVSMLGCSGSVEQMPATGGAAGGGSGGATGGSGGLGGSVSGGSGGTGAVGGAGGSGGAITCGHGYESLNVQIDSTNAPLPPCTMGGAESNEWQETGSVVKSDLSGFVIDTCPPNADCMASFTSVTVTASGLSLAVPVGAFVKVKLEQLSAWGGCNTRISVRNVASWGGMPNPVMQTESFYFLGVDGVLDHPDAPFTVSKLPLGCGGPEPSCGEAADDYALTFNVGPGDPGTSIGMGQTQIVSTPGQPMAVHNLRSYVSGACDDYWNWAWWAAPAALK